MATTNYNLYVDWNNDNDYSDADENISSYIQNIEWERGRDLANNLTGSSVSGVLKVTLRNPSNILVLLIAVLIYLATYCLLEQ